MSVLDGFYLAVAIVMVSVLLAAAIVAFAEDGITPDGDWFDCQCCGTGPWPNAWSPVSQSEPDRLCPNCSGAD